MFHGFEQLFPQFFDGFVIGQEEVVEAGVRRGKALLLVAVARNGHLDLLEAAKRGPVAAGQEFEEGLLLLLVELIDNFPEKLNCLRFIGVPVNVSRRLLQLREIQYFLPVDREVEFLGSEHFDHAAVHHAEEACGERLPLLLDREVEHPVHVLLHKLLFVLLGDGHLAAVRNQIETFLLTETLVGN